MPKHHIFESFLWFTAVMAVFSGVWIGNGYGGLRFFFGVVLVCIGWLSIAFHDQLVAFILP
jgi:hypothetical protein